MQQKKDLLTNGNQKGPCIDFENLKKASVDKRKSKRVPRVDFEDFENVDEIFFLKMTSKMQQKNNC